MADSLPPTFYAQLAALESAGAPFVLVVLAEAFGSTPQDTGAKMLVTPAGLLSGTVGGGRVEAKAILTAQEMLADTGTDRGRPAPLPQAGTARPLRPPRPRPPAHRAWGRPGDRGIH